MGNMFTPAFWNIIWDEHGVYGYYPVEALVRLRAWHDKLVKDVKFIYLDLP